MTDNYTPPKVNELKMGILRERAGTQGLGYDKVLADVALLIGELAKVKQASRAGERLVLDDQLFEHLVRKYGVSN